MKIYTRRGDKGKTFLPTGQKVAKFDTRIEIYGAIDELNSILGISIVLIQNDKSKLKDELIKIQTDLFNIPSLLDLQKTQKGDAFLSLPERVLEFERLIDDMTGKLPKLNNFILPGGGKAGANLHLARAICRRLERRIVKLNSKQKLNKDILIYFNRLSDLLFTMARFVNFKEKRKEIIWRKQK